MMDLEKLKALAEAATQGEWTCRDKPDGRFWHIGCGSQAIGSTYAASKKSNPDVAAMFEANAKFIVAANPAAVLELITELEGYRMGAKVEADAGDEARSEGRKLKAENEALRECVEDLALSLECEVKARYAGTQKHPAIKRKYDGDMLEVIDARALLASQKATSDRA